MRRLVASIVLAVGIALVAAPADKAVALTRAPASLAGQFCKKTELGQVKTADNGAAIKCVRDGDYNRWLVK